MYEIDPNARKEEMGEYLRRNQLHAASVGAEAGAKSALKRVSGWKHPPKWLVASLEGVIERCERVAPEMAAHRNEIEVYRKKSERKLVTTALRGKEEYETDHGRSNRTGD